LKGDTIGGHDNPRVMARDARRIQTDRRARVATDDTVALSERNLPGSGDDPEGDVIGGAPVRPGRHLDGVDLKRIAEPMNRADEAGWPLRIAESRSDLRHDRREVGLRNERPRPHELEQLRLRERSWPAIDKGPEQLERLR
jgi:hypothetical protein